MDAASCRQVWEKIMSMQILCKNGTVFQDSASGINQWVYNPEAGSMVLSIHTTFFFF